MQTRTIGPVTVSAIGLGGMPMSKAPVVIPIPGASRPESIIDSAQAPELVLSPEELARLDESRS